MFCNKCGTEFRGEERCPKCGHPAESPEAVASGRAVDNNKSVINNDCPECGCTVPIWAHNCPNCNSFVEKVEVDYQRMEDELCSSGIMSGTRDASGGIMSTARLITYIIMWALCAAGIILGIVLIAEQPFGWYFNGSITGKGGEYAAFGGDFYTEIHARASAIADNTDTIVYNTYAIASNIGKIGEVLQQIAGSFMILLSGFKVCSTVLAFIKERDNG